MEKQLFFSSHCKKYGLSLWQCPQFLFFVMGIMIIVATLAAYFIGSRYVEDPLLVALIIILLAMVLFIISFIITQGFERLAEANRMKSEFVSIVSHQLRSPLTNLRWALSYLISEDMKDDPAQKAEYYKILQENAGRMGDLIDNLLIVSRMEQKTMLLKKEELSMEELINALIRDSEMFSAASNIKIDFKSEAGLPKIFFDEYQIKLLLDNLLSNAIHYTKGGGTVEIRLLRKNKNLFFEIKDSGMGIPKEDQKYIFQKFFRAQNAVQKQTQGSGLGLYIAKSVVDAAGGKIGFKSEEQKGSTFWFTLPIK
ncbi:MAG: HAMP domain-containing sensor histidine kinase [Parcubacteria group bacterium]